MPKIRTDALRHNLSRVPPKGNSGSSAHHTPKKDGNAPKNTRKGAKDFISLECRHRQKSVLIFPNSLSQSIGTPIPTHRYSFSYCVADMP